MTRPAGAWGDRFLGRSLLTLANVITVAGPVFADWNDSHIFNGRWPGHARFHGVTALPAGVPANLLGAAATTATAAAGWFIDRRCAVAGR
jgi:hypothetical protein